MNAQRRERVIGEAEAAGWIESGMTIAIGQPTPMAIVRQIIRRRLKDLTVVDAGFSLDMLIAAGCVRKVASYYAGGGFGNPVMPSFRRAAERGEIEVWECEEGILCAGLQAAAQGLPFLPWRGGVGTSIPEVNRDLKVFSDPISGETLIAVPPIDKALGFLAERGPNADTVVRPRRAIIGTPAVVKKGIEELAALYGAEDAMIVSITYDHGARRRSYELIAEAFGLGE